MQVDGYSLQVFRMSLHQDHAACACPLAHHNIGWHVQGDCHGKSHVMSSVQLTLSLTRNNQDDRLHGSFDGSDRCRILLCFFSKTSRQRQAGGKSAVIICVEVTEGIRSALALLQQHFDIIGVIPKCLACSCMHVNNHGHGRCVISITTHWRKP